MISYFLRGEPSVIAELQKYREYFEQITFSILTYYEIVSGLKYRDGKYASDSLIPNPESR